MRGVNVAWLGRCLRGLALLLLCETAGAVLPGQHDLLWGRGVDLFPFELYSVAVQPDGKLVGVGYARGEKALLLLRLERDGSLDLGFSEDGHVTLAVGDGFTMGSSVIVSADGSIVVFASARHAGELGGVVAKFLPSGALDRSFAEEGVYRNFDFGLQEGWFGGGANSLVEQADGKLLFAGQVAATAGGEDTDVVVVRLNADGTPDDSFGEAGRAIFAGGAGSSYPAAIAVSARGEVYVAGNVEPAPGEGSRPFLARLLPDGALDPSFGASGIWMSMVDERGLAGDLAIQADGAVVWAALHSSDGRSSRTSVMRLDGEGRLDPTFGEGGRSELDLGEWWEVVGRVVIDDAGRILVGGTHMTWDGDSRGGFVVRLAADGSRDGGFGDEGVIHGRNEGVFDLALDDDGGLFALFGPFALERFFNGEPSYFARISANTLTGPAPLTVEFSGEGVSEDGREVVGYAWDFDDRESSTERNPSHTFDREGEYRVTLTVTAASGERAATYRWVRVTEPVTDPLRNGALACLFDWAETSFPLLFQPGGVDTRQLELYHYRHYPRSATYLGYSVADEHLYFFDDVSGMVDLGGAEAWFERAGCP